MQVLDLDAETALFDGKLSGLVMPFYENERPLRGLAGLFDWRFRGAFSNGLRAGAFSGHEGECIYLPVSRTDRTFHFFLVGGGQLSRYGRRGLVPDGAFNSVRENLKTLGLKDIGLSRSDFGNLSEEYLSKYLMGAPLWLIP